MQTAFSSRPSSANGADSGDRRRTGDGVAAIGAAVRAGRPAFHQLAPGNDPGERQARGQSLGDGDDVGCHPKVFEGEPLARAPEAGLNLVGDEQDAVLVAQPAQAGQEAGRGTT